MDCQIENLDMDIQDLKNQALVHAEHISEYIPQIVDKEKLLADLMENKIDMQMVIFRGICQNSDLLQEEVMVARYIQGLKWAEIAVELEISVHYCYVLHKKALRAFDNFFERRVVG